MDIAEELEPNDADISELGAEELSRIAGGINVPNPPSPTM